MISGTNRTPLLGIPLVLAFACHGAPGSTSQGDASTDDSSGACFCVGSTGSTTTTVPCGAAGCSGGTAFVCSYGTPIPIGTCGGDDGGLEASTESDATSSCTPRCDGVTCGNDDGCGGTCQCSAGLPCVGGSCGNGCQRQVGDLCSIDGGAGGVGCCQSGYLCSIHDGGIALCCTVTSGDGAAGGSCLQDSDCCDYPAVHCQASGTCG
jgi:hypothetical protein